MQAQAAELSCFAGKFRCFLGVESKSAFLWGQVPMGTGPQVANIQFWGQVNFLGKARSRDRSGRGESNLLDVRRRSRGSAPLPPLFAGVN